MTETVTANGRRFRINRKGSGLPLVVFESGLATGGSAWIGVQRKVSAHTATLSYDRAGIGGSQPAKDGRRFADLNADLEAILDALGEDGPLILVGQSWGGPTIRAFAHYTRRPLAGLVIVDGTRAGAMTEEQSKGLHAYFSILGLLSRVGLHRKMRAKIIDNITSGLSAEDSALVLRDMMSGRSCRGGAKESAGLVEEMPLLADLQAKGSPAGVPVTFLAAGVAEPGTEEMRAAMIAGQQDEAAALGQRCVLVHDSRHDIHMHQPDLVVAEVLALVDSVV